MTGGTPADPTAAGRPGQRVLAAFAERFGGEPDGRWWAPARVNLIGEHTDYNDGYVLPLALAHGVAAAARVADRPVLRVHSLQQQAPVELPLADIAPGAVRGWSAYVGGVAWALRAAGHDLPGLDVVVDGDVPAGAGLASSAALECAVALAWDDLAGLGLSREELVAAARRAENDVVGTPTGGMDQMASLHARAGHLAFLDMRSLAVEHVPFDPPAADLALLVIDSRAPHALVDGEYAERHRSCRRAAELLGVAALRDVPPDGLDEALAHLGRAPGGEVLRARVRHVVSENARVLDVVAALRSGADPRRIGPLLTASHASMRDDFTITVPEVDTAVGAALDAGAHGSRMTGGGFGGCVVALVDAARVADVVGAVEVAYAAAGYRAPAAFVATAGDGARRIS
ncbi:MAG: galactokinase [Pseudonocardia sp.]|nr:galactokinase [Pseudonocardia sp.]